MYFCYMDESGTSEIPGNTSHFVLVGIAIPISKWKKCDTEIKTIQIKYQLQDTEIHVAWIVRSYLEQKKIQNFKELDYTQRRINVESYRKNELLRLQRQNDHKLYRQTLKNYRKTEPYIHLTLDERKAFIKEVAGIISKWTDCRLFAECIDKIYFSPQVTQKTIDEQSFEQIVSRFEQFLQIQCKVRKESCYGLLIHDNNQNVALNHTQLMKKFHEKGTLWTQVSQIIETPFFVDSQLTSMIQIADICSFAIRRYLENNEQDLFELIFRIADKKDGVVVGVRHYTKPGCQCIICKSHKRTF
jgi:hypothetical protein